MATLRRRMSKTGTDLVVVGPTSHLTWQTSLSPHGDERPVLLAVAADRAGFLMPALNADSQRSRSTRPFFGWSDADGPDPARAELLDHCTLGQRPASVALDEAMHADFAFLVQDALPNVRRSFLDATIGALRLCKSGPELDGLRASARLNDQAMLAGVAALAPGVSEREVVAAIARRYQNLDVEPLSISVCFGANTAFPHPTPGDRRLQADDMVLLDLCGRSGGFPSDMTRVVRIGAGPEGSDEIVALVERAAAAALAATRPGARARDIDQAARDVIADAGHGPHFLHRTGHGLGIDLHEPPYIAAASRDRIAPAQVFSIEPGIYLPGRFGVRLEDVVVVGETGCTTLSGLPRSILVPP